MKTIRFLSAWVLVGLIAFPQMAVPQTAQGKLVNISCRTDVDPGPSNPLIAGFVVSGGPKQVLIRAVGPGLLAFGVSNACLDPMINIYRSSTLVNGNDNWRNQGPDPSTDPTRSPYWDIADAAVKVGAFPLEDINSLDSAILTTLEPGAYTVHAVNNTSVRSNILIEVYEVP